MMMMMMMSMIMCVQVRQLVRSLGLIREWSRDVDGEEI